MTNINDKLTLGCEDRQTIEQLETLLIGKLHLINVRSIRKLITLQKLEYHEREMTERNQLFFKILHPFQSLTNFLDLHYLQKEATKFHNIYSKVHRKEIAREIFTKLSSALREKRVFFDHPPEEFKHHD